MNILDKIYIYILFVMAASSDIMPEHIQHAARKKSGSFTVLEYTKAEKKTKSLSRGLGRIRQNLLKRSHSTANIESVMHNAVLRDDPDTLKAILTSERVPQLDKYTPVGITALHQACNGGSLACVKLLVKAGADIHLKTKNSLVSTPLQLAVRNGHFEVAEYLISKGAKDGDIKDGHQKES